MDQRTIVIIGATGTQGSAVAQAFLKLPQWHVRCMTRSMSSPKAQALSKAGADLVEADLATPRSLDKAFSGAHAIFLNTDFWAPYNNAVRSGMQSLDASQAAYDTELQWGRNAIIAASKVPTLERLIYSALGSTKIPSDGKYVNGLHWESKAALVDWIQTEHKPLYAKTSLIYVGAYSSNALLRPHWDKQTGQYVAILPAPKSTKCPVIDAAGSAMGNFVRELIENEPPGTKLLAYEEDLTFHDTYEAWSRVTGKDYKCIESTLDEVHALTNIPLEVLEVPAFLAEHHFMAGVKDWIKPSELKNKVVTKTFTEYLQSLVLEDLTATPGADFHERFTK